MAEYVDGLIDVAALPARVHKEAERLVRGTRPQHVYVGYDLLVSRQCIEQVSYILRSVK